MNKFPGLKWSFSTLGCPELSLSEIVALAKANNMTEMELRAIDDRVDLPVLFKEQFGTPDKLKAYLDAEGMTVTALDTSLKLVGNTPEQREEFLGFIEWAEALGTSYLRIFDGGTFAPDLSSEDVESALDTIAWWRGLKAENGWKVDIMVETHDCLTASTALKQLQDKLDVPLPMLWDTHHTWKKGGENPMDTWKALGNNTVHIHVKDSISEPSARHPMTYVMLGEGEFPLEETLALLNKKGFSGLVSIEWERKWHPYLVPLSEALDKAKALNWR